MFIRGCLSSCFSHWFESSCPERKEPALLSVPKPSLEGSPSSPLESRLSTPLPDDELPTETTPLHRSYISPPLSPNKTLSNRPVQNLNRERL